MISINQIYELNIINQNYDGLGVAKINDMVVFVKGAICGEKVKAKVTKVSKNYCLASLIEIIDASPERITPLCPYFGKCGGCDLLHIKYDAGLKLKLDCFNETLKRIGKIDYEAKEIYGMDYPYRYRNKIQMPTGMDNQKLVFGYYKKDTHKVIAINDCLVQSENVSKLINFIKKLCDDLNISSYDEETKKGAIRHILVRENYKDELMVVLVTNEDSLTSEKTIISEITKNFPQVISIIKNINTNANNVILGKKSKVLFGKDEINDKILDNVFKISHRSFFQINRTQTNKLYSIVLDYLGDDTKNLNVIDGYCGVGSISLCLAKKVKHVYGIEVVQEAIEDAKNNAKINNISNAIFYCGKVEELIDRLIDKDIDCIIIDPPRKGVEEKVINSIINAQIKKIIYVSCNPASLARDLGLLKDYYNIEDIKLVDMFCHTTGVECTVRLGRKD